MLDVRRLYLLRELERRGTIAAVAEALTFTASAVSQQLSMLEREAGVPLLERSGRRVVLTPRAARSSPTPTRSSSASNWRSPSWPGHARASAGRCGSGRFPLAASRSCPPRWPNWPSGIPRWNRWCRRSTRRGFPTAYAPAEFDVALVHDYDFVPASPDTTVDQVPLLEEPMYLATDAATDTDPARCPAARGDTLAELLGPWATAPWITARDGTTGHAMAVRACQAAGFQPRIRHQVNDFRTVLALAAIGQGAGFVPEMATAHAPEDVVLTRLPLFRRSKVAFRAGGGTHPAIAAFVAAARTAVGATSRASLLIASVR